MIGLNMNLQQENILFEKIKNDDEKAFEELFHRFYSSLCLYASKLLHDDDDAEELVQDFFVKFWDKRHRITIDSSVKSYLFRSVKNSCMNHLKHKGIIKKHEQQIALENDSSPVPDDFYDPDLFRKIEDSINALPEKRQEIFRLSREKGYKYREIAELLQISIKTVETQMGLAIKTLRENLKDLFPL